MGRGVGTCFTLHLFVYPFYDGYSMLCSDCSCAVIVAVISCCAAGHCIIINNNDKKSLKLLCS